MLRMWTSSCPRGCIGPPHALGPRYSHRPRTRARDGRTMDSKLMRWQQIIMTFGARVQIMSTSRSACDMDQESREDRGAYPRIAPRDRSWRQGPGHEGPNFVDWTGHATQMVRPRASAENKGLGLLFARMVNCSNAQRMPCCQTAFEMAWPD